MNIDHPLEKLEEKLAMRHHLDRDMLLSAEGGLQMHVPNVKHERSSFVSCSGFATVI